MGPTWLNLYSPPTVDGAAPGTLLDLHVRARLAFHLFDGGAALADV
jgi:hypothetical protein